MTVLRRLRDEERGSTLLLTVFFGLLSIVLILVVSAATSLYLERTRLSSVADGAALAGAESFALGDVGHVDGVVTAALDDAQVEAAVREHLALTGEIVELVRAGTSDERSATVTLATMWHPPVVGIVLPEGVRIEVTATARSVFG